jgi:hypothetical protein
VTIVLVALLAILGIYGCVKKNQAIYMPVIYFYTGMLIGRIVVRIFDLPLVA